MNSSATQEASIPQSNFTVPDPLEIPSLRGVVSDAEWALRCELAATYRLCALFEMDDHIFTHISVRLPDQNGQRQFLMNPYGVGFEEMTASSLLVVDEQGEVVRESPYFSNPAGFTIHSAVHMARDDAHCVLHLHSPYGVAVSAQTEGLLACTQFSMVVMDDLAYHDYEGIATNLEERDRLVADLGEKGFMILRNHGTLTVGGNCGIAFLRMYFLDQACKAQILAQAGGASLIRCDAELTSNVGKQGRPAFVPGMGDNLAWPAFIRRLKRQNPGWDN